MTLLEGIAVTEDIVKKVLDGLKVTSSPGPDKVHPRVLKEVAAQMAKPLPILFQKSLDT